MKGYKPMTVKELQDFLSDLPPYMEVVIQDNDFNIREISCVFESDNLILETGDIHE